MFFRRWCLMFLRARAILTGLLMPSCLLAQAASASALTFSTQYEMGGQPSSAANVTDTNSADWNLGGVLTNLNMSSGNFSGSLHYVSTGASQRGYYFFDQQATHTNHSFTIDMRVQVISGVTPATGSNRSMSFSGGPVNGWPNSGRNRGFRLNTTSVQLVNGGGAVGTGNADLASGYVRLRVAYNTATNNYSVYNLDAAMTLIAPQVGGGSGAAAQITDIGGYAIGSLDTASSSDFQLDYFRVLLDTAVEDATTVINQIGSCTTNLDKSTTQTSVAAQGQAASPSSIAYTLTNTGSTAVNYTVVEATAAGVTTDYPWLSVSPGSGSVGVGSNATITANIINTTGLGDRRLYRLSSNQRLPRAI